MFNRVKVHITVDGPQGSINIEVEREYLTSGDLDTTISYASAEAAVQARAAVKGAQTAANNIAALPGQPVTP